MHKISQNVEPINNAKIMPRINNAEAEEDPMGRLHNPGG